MKVKGVLVFWVLSGVVGCGSRTVESLDGGNQDSFNPMTDGGVDWWAAPDGWQRDMPPPRDMPWVRDLPPIPDQAIPLNNNHCKGATLLSWVGGKATGSGDLSKATNTVDLTYPNGCNLKSTPGPDQFYEVSVVAGKVYKVTVDNAPAGVPLWPVFVYVFESCNNPSGTCLAGTPSPGPLGSSVTFTAQKTGTLLIGVDGPSMGQLGPFTVTVEELKPYKNDTCATAASLTWSGGKATASDDLALANNDLDMTYPNGCNLKSTPGPDLFYKVSVVASKAYRVTVTQTGTAPGPMPSFPAMIYVFESCADPKGTCIAGTPSPGPMGSSVTFTAKKTGTLYVGVDSYSSPYGPAPFTLTVQEHIPPTNNTCATAAALALSGTPGKATVTGDSSMATSDVNLTYPNKCNISSTVGPDVFYSLKVTLGQGYKVTVSPTGTYPWSSIVYVFESCADPAGTCLSGSSYGSAGSVATFSAKKTGTVYIAVDSSSSSSYGSGPFTLTVEEYQAPKNDTCASAQVLTLSGTPKKATASGDTSLATNAESLLYPNSCNLKGAPGPELFYALPVEKGKGYAIQVATSTSPVPPPGPVPPPTWMPVVYVFDSCSNAAGTCIAGSQSYSPTGPTVTFIAGSTKTVYIAVDSSSSSTYSSGPFTLTVEETTYKPVCTIVKPLTFDASGVAKATGDTSTASNDVTLAGSSCYQNATAGGDLFYSVALAAGKTYTVTLSGAFDPVLFLFTDCNSPTGSCLLASDKKGYGTTETLSITPGSNTTYYIGVDSTAGGGSFALTVK
jgi:hypothetical protein